MPPSEGELDAAAIWAQEAKLGPLLEELPAAKHRRALESFKAANPEHWHDALQASLNSVSAKLCHELAGLLIQEGKIELLKDTVARLVSQHTASSELLLWLAKDRNDSFADILGPEVFRAMLTAMERDQFNERRSNRLRDYILDDQQLLVELIGSADFEVIKDLTRALQLSPSFDDMDKRSLLARIVKSYPAIQVLISGEQSRQEAALAGLVGEPGAAQERIPRAGGEEDTGQFQGNRDRPQLWRLERESRIQGRQGNAEAADAAQGGPGNAARPGARHGFRRSAHRRRERWHRGAGDSIWRRTSRSTSRFSGHGIPSRRRILSATFPRSPNHCSATKSGTRSSSRSTESVTTIASNLSCPTRPRSAGSPRSYALPPKVTWSSTSSRSNQVAMSSRLGATFACSPWKYSRDSVSDGARWSMPSRPRQDFRVRALVLRALLNPLQDLGVALSGRKLLLKRVRVYADEAEEALVHRAGVMIFAVFAGDRRAALIEHARQNDEAAEPHPRAAGRTLR